MDMGFGCKGVSSYSQLANLHQIHHSIFVEHSFASPFPAPCSCTNVLSVCPFHDSDIFLLLLTTIGGGGRYPALDPPPPLVIS